MLTRFKIGPRLAAGFAVVLILSAMVGGFALSRLAEVNANVTDLATNWLVASQALGQYADAMNVVRRSEVATLMARDAHEAADQATRIVDARKASAQAWNTYAATIEPGEERGLADKIEQAQGRYLDAMAKTVSTAAQGPASHDQALAIYLGESRTAFADLTAALVADKAFQSRGGATAYTASQDSFGKARIEVFGLLGLAIVLGAVIAWRITLSITRPLNQFVNGFLSLSLRVQSIPAACPAPPLSLPAVCSPPGFSKP